MKKWYASKTVWVNALMLAGVVVQQASGENLLDESAQAAIITVVNLLLRVITKEKLEW